MVVGATVESAALPPLWSKGSEDEVVVADVTSKVLGANNPIFLLTPQAHTRV